MNYYKLNMALSSGILIGVWSNFLYQIKDLNFNMTKFNKNELKEYINNFENNEIIL